MPSVEKVQQLARYLGVTTSELLGEAPQVAMLHDSAVRISASDARRLTVSEVDMVLAYRRADDRTKTMVQLALEPFGKGEAADSAG